MIVALEEPMSMRDEIAARNWSAAYEVSRAQLRHDLVGSAVCVVVCYVGLFPMVGIDEAQLVAGATALMGVFGSVVAFYRNRLRGVEVALGQRIEHRCCAPAETHSAAA